MRPRRGDVSLNGSASSQDGLFPLGEEAAPRAPHASSAPREPALKTTSGFATAESNPVALVHVLGTLPHLDRPFEYAVPSDMDDLVPGQRVRVRFAGKEHEGLVRTRYASPETDRALAPIVKRPSTDIVIDEKLFRVCEDVARRYAGSVADVLRLAIPARSARAEKQGAQARRREEESLEGSADNEDEVQGENETDPEKLRYRSKFSGLAALLTRAGEPGRGGVTPRASIVLDPVDSWIDLAIEAVSALPRDRGAIVMTSDQRDADRAKAAFREAGLETVMLASAAGPHRRYSAFLSLLQGRARIAIGTRSVAFAPVPNLSLIVMFDPDDDLYEEPRAPYPHARTVALSRSYIESVPALFLAPSPSPTMTVLEDSGVLERLDPAPASHASTHPRIELMDEYLREREGASGYSRLPQHAYQRMREGLKQGPVLVQVPRAGYASAFACSFCGTRATCHTCHGTLAAASRSEGMLVCKVCGRSHGAYRCPECDRTQMRPAILGATRTADDLRRAFPEATLRVSGGAQGAVADSDVADGDLVIATPGAEPHPRGGYAAAIIVDADLSLARAVFDADTESVRRFSHAIALTRPFCDAGQVLVIGQSRHRALQSLVLPRSRAFVRDVLDERAELGFPPLAKVIEVLADQSAMEAFVANCDVPASADVLGPTAASDQDHPGLKRLVLRSGLDGGRELTDAVRAAAKVHSAKKVSGSLRVQVDPPHVF